MKKARILNRVEYIAEVLSLLRERAVATEDQVIQTLADQIQIACNGVLRDIAASTSARVEGEPVIRGILRVLKDAGQPMTVSRIAAAVGCSRGNVDTTIRREMALPAPRLTRRGEKPILWTLANPAA